MKGGPFGSKLSMGSMRKKKGGWHSHEVRDEYGVGLWKVLRNDWIL